jgi:hypothetical protein
MSNRAGNTRNIPITPFTVEDGNGGGHLFDELPENILATIDAARSGLPNLIDTR